MKKQCKTFIFLIMGLLLSSLLFTACSDDDDQTTIPEEILGTWKLTDMSIGSLTTSDADIEDAAKQAFTALTKEFYFGEAIEFNEDGFGEFQGESIKFSTNKNSLTMIDGYGNKLTFTYAISGSKLILSLDMKAMILNDDELDKEDIAYIKEHLKKFTVDFTLTR